MVMGGNSDIQVYIFGNGRQTVNPALGNKIKVKSGWQEIPGMKEDVEYTGRLVEVGTKHVVRFRTNKGNVVDIPLMKLHFIKQV